MTAVAERRHPVLSAAAWMDRAAQARVIFVVEGAAMAALVLPRLHDPAFRDLPGRHVLAGLAVFVALLAFAAVVQGPDARLQAGVGGALALHALGSAVAFGLRSADRGGSGTTGVTVWLLIAFFAAVQWGGGVTRKRDG